MTVEEVRDKYEPRILAGMNAIKDTAIREGYTVEGPEETSDEEFSWALFVGTQVDITFTIVESKVREGTDEGISFMLDIVESGGRILGAFSPYNYTPKLWVPLDDPDAIEERFRMMEQVDLDGVMECVGAAR